MRDPRTQGSSHYKSGNTGAIETIDFLARNKVPFMEANVIKYVMRHALRNGKEDILKAIHYLKFILWYEYEGEYQEPGEDDCEHEWMIIFMHQNAIEPFPKRSKVHLHCPNCNADIFAGHRPEPPEEE